MSERVVCFDTSVYIKYLTPDEQDEAATRQVEAALAHDAQLVAPSWAWAEVGSVLRKKVRQGLLLAAEAETLWSAFLDLPIAYVDSEAMRASAWEIASQYGLPTLYDACFLACLELVPSTLREFWTADDALIKQLGEPGMDYVHRLGA